MAARRERAGGRGPGTLLVPSRQRSGRRCACGARVGGGPRAAAGDLRRARGLRGLSRAAGREVAGLASRPRHAGGGRDERAGNFADAKFRHAGVTSTFFRRGGKYFVNTDGPDGKLADFEIRYTFGATPLQQYLIEFPGGRIQALGIAWDTRPRSQGGQRWFHLYPDEKLRAGDPLHWTGLQQNWNFMCAECHSTDLHKRYDAQTDRFDDPLRRDRRLLRGVPRPRIEPRGVGPPRGRLEAGRRRPRAHACARRTPGRRLDDRPRDRQRAAQPRPRIHARDRDVRPLPCAREPHLRRLRAWQAAARLASRRAPRRGAVLERRPDARRGLRSRLLPPEPDVREGGHVQRLPRAALAEAEGARRRGVRAVPSGGQVRRAAAPLPSRRFRRRGVRGLPHADRHLHADRSPP